MMTAAKHAAVAVGTTERIGLRGALIRPVPIEAPLGDIAVHVVQAPDIRSLFCDAQRTRTAGSRFLRRMIQAEDLALLQRRRGGLARGAPVILARHWAGRKVDSAIVILAEPLLVSIRQRVAGVEERRCARAAGILPLRLRRQAVGLALLLRKPRAERHRPLPRHAADGVVIRWLRLRVARFEAGFELPILRDRDLGHAHQKRPRDRDLMGGLFVEVDPAGILVHLAHPLRSEVVDQGRSVLPHRERPRLDAHELHAEGVGDVLRRLCGAEGSGQCKGEERQNQRVEFHRRKSQVTGGRASLRTRPIRGSGKSPPNACALGREERSVPFLRRA